MVVSPEKEELLKPLVAQFNAEQSGAKPAFVKLRAENSGDTEAAIARGRPKPDVWSPASAFWGRLLNLQADKPYVADDNPSIVRTPLVIAIWEPMAKALGWPKKQISFDQIVKLATAPDGWAAAGKPQFGRFKYVHTNPDSSTSGASAVTGSYYAFVSKKEGLTEADVAKAAPKVKELERSIVHYGDSTLFIERPAVQGRPGLRQRGRDGGDDGDRLQPPQVPLRQARRALSDRGLVHLGLAVHRAQRRLGDAGEEGRRGGVPEVPGRAGHARGGRQVRLPAGRSGRPRRRAS